MKALEFREKEIKLNEEIVKVVKEKMIALGRKEIRMSDHELNCPCINSGAPESDLHTISSIELHLGQVTFNIDDQNGGYNSGGVPLDSLIDLLGQIEDLKKEDFEELEDDNFLGTMCKKYTDAEALPDNDGNCSLCGSDCVDQ